MPLILFLLLSLALFTLWIVSRAPSRKECEAVVEWERQKPNCPYPFNLPDFTCTNPDSPRPTRKQRAAFIAFVRECHRRELRIQAEQAKQDAENGAFQ